MNYNRKKAVEYAHKWAMGRNPRYYDFSSLGGDCANFASQCIFAGGGIMNYTPTFGWYYVSSYNRSPSWSGVQYLQNFLLRNAQNTGPYAEIVPLSKLDIGDIIQLGKSNDTFYHTLVVVSTDYTGNTDKILIASHSFDSDNRPLSSYVFDKLKCMHILGIRP